jgi:hypothetical protein
MSSMIVITYKLPRALSAQKAPAASVYTLTSQGRPWTGGFAQAVERLREATGIDTAAAQLALVTAWTQGTAQVAPQVPASVQP